MAGFCEYLVGKGRITATQLARAKAETDALNLVLGQCAYAFGFLEEMNIVRILGIQRHTGQRFGEIAVALGYLSKGQLQTLLKLQHKYRIPLEEALVNDGALSREDLEAERHAFETAGAADR